MTATEHDFLGEVWVPIMIAIFHQDSDLRVKRYVIGEYFTEAFYSHLLLFNTIH